MRPAQCLVVRFACVREEPAGSEPSGTCVDPADFIRRLDDLCSRFEPVDWPTFFAWKQGRHRIPARCCLITFDDTLRDHLEVAAPILATRGLRGTFFVATAPLVTGRLTTSHEMHLLASRVPTADLGGAAQDWMRVHAPDQLDTKRPSAPQETPADAAASARPSDAGAFLPTGLPDRLRQQLLDDLFERWFGSTRTFAQERYLTWANLTEMQAAGHTIGGHSHLHLSYFALSRERRRHDFERSVTILQQGLGDGPRPFAYPYGDCDRMIADECRSAGFADGFTLDAAWIRRGADDFTLGRCCCSKLEQFLEADVSASRRPTS